MTEFRRIGENNMKTVEEIRTKAKEILAGKEKAYQRIRLELKEICGKEELNAEDMKNWKILEFRKMDASNELQAIKDAIVGMGILSSDEEDEILADAKEEVAEEEQNE